MPRNGSGTYSLPEAPFVPTTTISSAAVNSDLSDIALALTNSIASDGQTPITGSFKLANGSAVAPSYSFATNTSSGIYNAGSGVMGFAVGGQHYFSFNPPGASFGSGIVGINNTIFNPIGAIIDLAATVTPTGWFLCYGQAVSRTTFPELFAVLGTWWGTGDGATTFNLPDLRGRVCAGVDAMGGSAAGRITNLFLGTALGEQTHTLSTAEIPSHSHTGSSGGMSANNPHHHTYTTRTAQVTVAAGGGAGNIWTLDSGGALTGDTDIDHTHSISIGNAGGGGSHNNLQPTSGLNKIIFAGRA